MYKTVALIATLSTTLAIAAPVALVNKQPISEEQLRSAIESPTNTASREANLDKLIAGVLLTQEGKKAKLDKSKEFKEQLARARDSILANMALNRYLSTHGISESAIQDRYNAFATKNATDYRVRHILLPSEAEAQEVKARIKNEDDFFAEAVKHSIDTQTGKKGGILGWTMTKDVVPEFGEALRTTPPKTISEPVKTQYGWHLIWVMETKAATLPSLDEMRAQITQELGQQIIADYLRSLREKADIVIN